MGKEKRKKEPHAAESSPHRVHLPGWLVKEEVGLGDVIKKTTYRVGIVTPCTGCDRRSTALNRWMVFSRW